MSDKTGNVLHEVGLERDRQDMKWGGPEHDDAHDERAFITYLRNYTGWADQMMLGLSWGKARRRLIQVAALAVAAVESLDRKYAPEREDRG